MSNTPHYFIAVPLSEDIKNRYADWQDSLKQELTYKQWPHKDDLHITLKFLGAVNEEQLNKLKNKLTSLEKYSPFEITTGGMGFFGNPRKPRVIWAGVEKTNKLASLQKDVEKFSEAAGFTPENRPYSPHITLAKKWAGKEASIHDIKTEVDDNQILTVNQIVIYRIYPGSTPKYRVEAKYELEGGAE